MSKKRQTKAEREAAAKRSAAAQKAAATRKAKAQEEARKLEARRAAAQKAAATRKANREKAKRSEAAKKGAATRKARQEAEREKKRKRSEAAQKGAETKRQKAKQARQAEGKPAKASLVTFHAGLSYRSKSNAHGKTNLHVELAVKADRDLVKPEDLNRILQHYAQTGEYGKGVYDIKILSWQHQHHAKQEPDDRYHEEEVRQGMLAPIAPSTEFYDLGRSEGDGG